MFTDNNMPLVMLQCQNCEPVHVITMNDTNNNYQNQINSHPMVTRANIGVFKPKLYNISIIVHSYEPSSVKDTLASPSWLQAMNNEYSNLILNQT